MSARSFALALSLVFLALAGCGGLGGEPQIVATMAPRVAVDGATPVAQVWQPDIANGARIFAERCVECHGVSGDGRGELVIAGSVPEPLDMTDRETVMAKSPLEWFTIITDGRIENLMPPWENALSESERWDVARYSYTLAYDVDLLARGERVWREGCGECEMPSVIPPVYSDLEYAAKLNREAFGAALTDSEAAAAVAYARMRTLAPGRENSAQPESSAVGNISGRVAHGTAGGLVPAEMVVHLRYGNGEIGIRVAETTIDKDSRFQFEEIPLSADLEYAVGTVYGGRLFSRRVSTESADVGSITIYDTTHDPLVVSVSRVDLSIEPITLEDFGDGLYIAQILTYRNSSDRVYTSGRGFDDGREAALLIQFPQGAQLLSGDMQGRYVAIVDVEGLPDSAIDSLPVMPGEVHDVRLEYWLPYTGDVQFEQSFNNLIDAAVTLRLADGLILDSDWLGQTGAEDAGYGYGVYSATVRLERDPQIKFGISGDPYATSSDDRMIVTSETLPALILGAIALAAALLGGISLKKRRQNEAGGEIEGLVAELARLEEEHDQGRINHDLYHHRRRELRAKLAQLMGTADE